MEMASPSKLKPLGPVFVGQIVGYVEKEEERVRTMLSLRKFHIVQTFSQQEEKVAKGIEEELGMPAYCPLVPSSRKNPKLKQAMFKGYIFVGFDPASDPWGCINRDMKGVIRLFRIDEHPVSVPHAAMERIRAKEAELANGRCPYVPLVVAKVGDIVRLVDAGAYSGLFVPVSQIDETVGRLCVKLELVGRPTDFWLNPEQIEVV